MSNDTTTGPFPRTGLRAGSLTPLEQYSAAASRSAAVVIGAYSTSFSLACRMLDLASRTHIANVYALVRLVDEVVDGVAVEAGLSAAATEAALDRLEAETEAALINGYSTNMIVHAFAGTARQCGIDSSLTRPFFASMRNDLSVATHNQDSLERYIFGSAEVVGLICLKVFLASSRTPAGHLIEAESAARRLGAAFQKVNFLRDLAVDTNELGRCYFPGLDPEDFSDEHKDQLVAEISADLDAAAAGIAFLPLRAAVAVAVAHGLFSELNTQLGRTSAAALLKRRISVSAAHKTVIALRALSGQALTRLRR